MRILIPAALVVGLSACTMKAVEDPLDTPIQLAEGDTIQIDPHGMFPINFAAQDRFIWTCGTFDLTPAERAALDSMAAVVRIEGGVLCY